MTVEQSVMGFFAFLVIAIGLVVLDAHTKSKCKWNKDKGGI